MADAKKGGGLGDLFSLGLGSLEPELRKAAQELASRVPADSFMRTETFERLFGAVRQFIEKKLDGLPSATKEVLERIVDIGDIFSAEVARKGSAGSASSATLGSWEQAFFAEARSRIMDAPTEEDKQSVAVAIRLEYTLIKEMQKLIEESAPKLPEKPAAPTTSPAETFRVSNDEWEADLKKRREAAKAARPSLLRRILADFGITWGKAKKDASSPATPETKSESAGDQPDSASSA